MIYVYLLILLALVQYIYFTAMVGVARGKYGVSAPATTGNDIFERTFRVQQNTMEQLVVFIPGMYFFAMLVSPVWALVPGVIFIVGRQIYSHGYISAPEKRGMGATMSLLSGIVLVVGALIGLIWKMI
jgi:hypothetical protein